jgi:hypothetical protein
LPQEQYRFILIWKFKLQTLEKYQGIYIKRKFAVSSYRIVRIIMTAFCWKTLLNSFTQVSDI